MKKRGIDLTTILIIVVVITIIIAIFLLLTKKEKNDLKCLIYSTNTLPTNEDINLRVYVRENNANIKMTEGLVKFNDYYEMSVTKNGIYTFYVTDGENENSCSIEVSNIVNNLNVNIKASTTKKTQSLTLTLSTQSTVELDSNPYSWDGVNFSKTQTLKVTKNGTYVGFIKDKSGNIWTSKYEVNNIATKIKATGITLVGNYNIEVNKTISLKANISPSNANDYKITW